MRIHNSVLVTEILQGVVVDFSSVGLFIFCI